jgi:oligopeptide/dipeptide ABC transporter ATP-binding protein
MNGEPPSLLHPPKGCRFHPRCPFVKEICKTEVPEFKEVAHGQMTACWLYQNEKDAPKPKKLEVKHV